MILIGLGGNLPFKGNPPERTLAAALALLDADADIGVTARSGYWRSAAWPDPSGPEYVNAAARLETALAPEALLARLHGVEARFGRVRSDADRWAARTLDLDLLDHDGAVRDSPELTLPHPRLAQRAFVLKPLAEIAPDWRAPDGLSVAELIAALPAEDAAATVAFAQHCAP